MCCSKGLLKRLLPFFLTFAVGLFIASFFVTVAAPNFEFNRGFRRHRQYDQMMQFENQRLRDENARLKAVSELKLKSFSGTFEMNGNGDFKPVGKMEASTDNDSLDNLVPPPPPISTVKARTIPYRVR